MQILTRKTTGSHITVTFLCTAVITERLWGISSSVSLIMNNIINIICTHLAHIRLEKYGPFHETRPIYFTVRASPFYILYTNSRGYYFFQGSKRARLFEGDYFGSSAACSYAHAVSTNIHWTGESPLEIPSADLASRSRRSPRLTQLRMRID